MSAPSSPAPPRAPRSPLAMPRMKTLALVVIALALGALAGLRAKRNAERARLRAGDVSRSALTLAEVDPHVALTADGHAAVSFMGVSHVEGEGDAARFIGARISDDRGASWGVLQELWAPGRLSSDSMVVADAKGGLVVTWLGFHQRLAMGGEPFDLEIYMARADAASAWLFGEPHHVTAGVRGADKFLRVDKPWTARTGDGALATSYRVEGALSVRVQVSRTTDGEHFEHAIVAEGHPFGGTLATICAEPAGPRAWVAYVDGSHGTFAEVVLHASEDGARSFPAARRTLVSRPGEQAVVEAPQCVFGDGVLWVAYGIGAAPPDDSSSAVYDALVLARSRDGGRTFDARFEVREDGARLMHPALARLPSGELEVLALVGAADSDLRGSVRRFRVGPDGAPRGPSAELEPNVRLVRKRAPLSGWTGDFFGLAAESDTKLFAFGVNGGDSPGPAHVKVTRAHVSPGPPAP